MTRATCVSSFHSALWVAWFQLSIACGGQSVVGSGGEETTGTGSDSGVDAGGTEATGTGSQASDGAGGGETTGTGGTLGAGGSGAAGSSSMHRDAASARAARFVNDYGVACKESKLVGLGEDPVSAYPTRVRQTRGRPGPYGLCAEIADADERLDCIVGLDCDFDWWNELDWSQWNAGSTVIEIVGPRPEQINVASSTVRAPPDPADPNGPRLALTSYYERLPEEGVPPGCHDCGYYWYLDSTPEGIALVLGPPLAGDLESGLSGFELDLCLIE